jgi:hypothetical protein
MVLPIVKIRIKSLLQKLVELKYQRKLRKLVADMEETLKVQKDRKV